MAMRRTAKDFITITLFVTFVLLSVPAWAQAPAGCPAPGPAVSVQTLACDLAALTARIAKLEGNTTPADLVGTYTLVGMGTSMFGFVADVAPNIPGNQSRPAAIVPGAGQLTITLNAGGSLSFGPYKCGGARLTQGSWTLTEDTCSDDPPPSSGTWNYSNGTLDLMLDNEGPFHLNVASGGRLAIGAFASFHPADPSSDTFLMILMRLK